MEQGGGESWFLYVPENSDVKGNFVDSEEVVKEVRMETESFLSARTTTGHRNCSCPCELGKDIIPGPPRKTSPLFSVSLLFKSEFFLLHLYLHKLGLHPGKIGLILARWSAQMS